MPPTTALPDFVLWLLMTVSLGLLGLNLHFLRDVLRQFRELQQWRRDHAIAFAGVQQDVKWLKAGGVYRRIDDVHSPGG